LNPCISFLNSTSRDTRIPPQQQNNSTTSRYTPGNILHHPSCAAAAAWEEVVGIAFVEEGIVVVEGSPFVAGVDSIGLVGVRCICERVLVSA